MEKVMKVRCSVAALALAGALAVSATAANAATVVFDFGVGSTGTATHGWTGDLTTSDAFTIGSQTVVATAFTPFWNPGDLYGKHGGGDENGLGLTNDGSGDHEIANGDGFIQLNVSGLTGALALAFGSTTGSDQWTVYGTNTAGSGSFGALPGGTHTIGSGTTESSLNLTGGYKYYDIVATGSESSNVLIKSLTVAGVPEPATWGLMTTGVFCVGAAMRRQRRSGFAVA
jgi:hypothetical protein